MRNIAAVGTSSWSPLTAAARTPTGPPATTTAPWPPTRRRGRAPPRGHRAPPAANSTRSGSGRRTRSPRGLLYGEGELPSAEGFYRARGEPERLDGRRRGLHNGPPLLTHPPLSLRV